MNAIQKLRWTDVLNDVLFPSDLEFEWFKMSFEQGFRTNDRDGLYVKGEFGQAEVSPLPGYYDREIECLVAGIDTVMKPWPKPVRDSVTLNCLVSNDYDLDEETLKKYECVKVKVHTIGDCQRVKKVREICGPSTKIRIDCNGRFSVDEAKQIVKTLSDVDLELIEQPCRTNKKNAKLRRKIDIPIALDESARTHKEIHEAKKLDAADIILVKVQPAGGLHKAIELVDHWEGDVIVAHMMESVVGINVGLALAKALDRLDFACGLVPPKLDNIVQEPIDI